MTTTKRPLKAKRKLSDITFENENAHIALVSKEQGHGANGHHYTMLMKSFSEEFLKKASQITVTMSINEYLQRFFGIWCSVDQELLARSLGFTTEGMDKAVVEQQEELLDANEPPEQPDCWESQPGDTEYEKWINYKLQSIQVMKSLFESENIEKSLLELSEEDYLKVLQDQELIEKAFAEIDSKKNSSAKAGDTSTNVDVEKVEGNTSVVKNKNKGNKSMSKDTQVIEKSVEVVEKAEFEAIQKSLSDTQVELQKALDALKQFEAEKKEAIAKSRKEQLDKACGKHAEVIFKACGELQEEMFVEVVKAFADMQEQISKSDAFKELGADVEDESVSNESPIAKALQARLSKQKQ